MAFTLKSSINHSLRETTVAAYDAAGAHICSATLSGTGSRVKARLTEEVSRDARMLQSKEQRNCIPDVVGMAVQSMAWPA